MLAAQAPNRLIAVHEAHICCRWDRASACSYMAWRCGSTVFLDSTCNLLNSEDPGKHACDLRGQHESSNMQSQHSTAQRSTCRSPLEGPLGEELPNAFAIACSCCCRMLLTLPRKDAPFCRITHLAIKLCHDSRLT